MTVKISITYHKGKFRGTKLSVEQNVKTNIGSWTTEPLYLQPYRHAHYLPTSDMLTNYRLPTFSLTTYYRRAH